MIVINYLFVGGSYFCFRYMYLFRQFRTYLCFLLQGEVWENHNFMDHLYGIIPNSPAPSHRKPEKFPVEVVKIFHHAYQGDGSYA